MKLFNNHSGLRGLPCLAEGIYWATGLSLTTPFTEGRLGVNNKASPPGRHQEQAPKQRCTFSPTTFSSVQFSDGVWLGLLWVLFYFFDHYIQSSVTDIWRPKRPRPASDRDNVTRQNTAGRHACPTSRKPLHCASGHGRTRYSIART